MPATYYHALLGSASGVPVPAVCSVETNFSGDKIALPTSAIWTSVPGDWTVEAWVNADDSNQYMTIIGMGTNGDEFGFFHFKTSTGTPGMIKCYQSGSGGDIVASSSGIIPINTWTHIAVTRRSSDSTFCTYVNGAPDLVNQAMLRAQTATISNSARSLAGDGVNEVLHGITSDVRVWNVARSAAQILANYNRRLTGSESGLLGYWRLDDGPVTTGTSAADSTSNAATGTLTSPPNCRFVSGGPSFLP